MIILLSVLCEHSYSEYILISLGYSLSGHSVMLMVLMVGMKLYGNFISLLKLFGSVFWENKK